MALRKRVFAQNAAVVTLEASKLFWQLSPVELKAVRWISQERSYKAGDEIFQEGDPGDGIYVLKEGLVEISATVGQGGRHVFSRIQPGDFFGEMAVLDYKQRSAWATAATDSTAYFIPRVEILKLIERSPVLAMSLLRETSNRARDFNRQYIREVVETERLTVIGRFAQTILHDLKNPLNTIGLSAEMLARNKADGETSRRMTKVIRHQVERITDLVGQVLEFTRGANGEVVLAPADYGAFVAQVVDETRSELLMKGVQIESEVPVPSPVLLIQPRRLSRVFYNLAQNASEAMGGKGKVTVRVRELPAEVVTEIQDTGPGIAPEVAERLFQPFATYGKAHGTGLGLSICKRIVEEHRGWISADNVPGGGAMFRFGLPLPSAGATGALPKA